jgi:prevent-host-death family protein
MNTVALTYAKAHFSELAERSANGEEILVTRHDVPLVKLTPANRLSIDEIQHLFTTMDGIRAGSRLGEKLSSSVLKNQGRR